MFQRYEVLFLTVPEITQDEIKHFEKDIDQMVIDQKGSILSFERWGKYRLTFPVRGNEYGVYFLVRFEGPASLIEKIRELCVIKLGAIVMRHMATNLEKEASLEYQRPKSLEEAPASRDMDSFLKENRVEGLFSSGDERPSSRDRFKPDFSAE